MPSFDELLDDPDDQDWDEWDRLQINSFIFDGLNVEVDGDLGSEIEVKAGPGIDGASMTNRGYRPMRPRLTWELRTRAHWRTYRELLAAVQPVPGKKATSIVEVVHPQLAIVKKMKFVIEKIHTLKKTGPQLRTAQFDLVEYFPAPKATPNQGTEQSDGSRLDDKGNRVRADHFGYSDDVTKKKQNALLDEHGQPTTQADQLPSKNPKPSGGGHAKLARLLTGGGEE